MTAYLTLGTDSSGRPVRLSPEFADWWRSYVAALGFTPVITQGGWQGGEGASASAGTHEGDALDLRVWDRTQREVEAMVRVGRKRASGAWLRNKIHGGFTDPHVHLVPGRWAHPAPSALRQWDACRNGRDGLASNGADYHPYPLASTPPEDDMADYARQLDRIEAELKETRAELKIVRRESRNMRIALATRITNEANQVAREVAEKLAES